MTATELQATILQLIFFPALGAWTVVWLLDTYDELKESNT